VSERLFSAAESALQTVVLERRLARIGTSTHQFSVRLASLAELDRYLYGGVRPPRFPAGGRRRLKALWSGKPKGARIEVTEYLSVFALRALR
jgi:hypothetical protein